MKNEITINGVTYSLEKDIANGGCSSCEFEPCDNYSECLAIFLTNNGDNGYIFKKKENSYSNRLFVMMDKSDSILVLDKIESIKIGGNYPFLGIYDLKVNGKTYSYGSFNERNEAYRKLCKALEGVI